MQFTHTIFFLMFSASGITKSDSFESSKSGSYSVGKKLVESNINSYQLGFQL